MIFLVIDDDALSRELIHLLLEVEGHQVSVAVSGADALRLLAQETTAPDVVLSDIQMPGMAGPALSAALRTVLPRHTVLLAMSGSRPEPSILHGFDGFLLKPFSVEQLHGTLQQKESARTSENQNEWQLDADSVATEGSDTPSQALNEEVYNKLRESMPAEQLGQLYALCLADVRSRIAEMHQLAAAGDDAAFRATAHAVKGGCGLIGASELYKLAESGEQNGLRFEIAAGTSFAETGTSSVTALLERFSSACDRLERILVAHGRS